MPLKGLFSRRSRKKNDARQGSSEGGGQSRAAERPHNNRARSGGGQTIGQARINVDFLNVRSAPNGTKVGQVSNGERLEVTGRQGNWLQIRYESGTAFIYAKYTTFESSGRSSSNRREAPEEEEEAQPSPVRAQEKPEEVTPEGGQRRPGLLARIFGRKKEREQGGSQRAQAPPVTGVRALNRLLARGNLSTREVQQAREMIEKLPEDQRGDAFERLQAAIPYASQRDNASTGARDDRSKYKGQNIGDVMCNLTALAMALQTLGVPNPHPEMQYEDALEKVRRDRGLPHRTQQAGWSGVARALGVRVRMLAGHGKRSRTFWTNNVRNALRSGNGVMMSIDGHIMRVQAVNNQGVVVDDPYGKSVLQGSSYGFSEANHSKTRNPHGRATAGNDHTWPWPMVLNHTHHWVAEFSN